MNDGSGTVEAKLISWASKGTKGDSSPCFAEKAEEERQISQEKEKGFGA
jgi:hypothetical protein